MASTTAGSAEGSNPSRRAWQRLGAFVAGLAVVYATVLAASRAGVSDLTIVLLVVLVEVLLLAVLSGPLLAAVASLVAVVLVNWYLVPPYQTFEIANADNVVALVVFTLVAVVAALLVELSARARARALVSAEQAELLGDVVSIEDDLGAADVLERIRAALGMDSVELSQSRGGRREALVRVGGADPDEEEAVRVELAEGYRLSAIGPPRLGADPEFLTSLGAAAVRAYEGDQLDVERRRAADLAAIDRARTALLASIGHDLRTPLASLRVAVDTLQAPSSVLGEEDRAALLETIDESTSRLDDLITNLLDMSRLEAGVVMVRIEPTAVDAVVARALLGLPDGRIDVDVADSLPLVSTDPALLERMVYNLVSNALRYGGQGARVLVVANPRGAQVEIDVVDHGPGIGAPERAGAFEPFRSTGDRKHGGSGLGLAIVRGFAAATGAGVDLLETPGGGLTARLVVPVAGPERGPLA